jgi:hypothetical protein
VLLIGKVWIRSYPMEASVKFFGSVPYLIVLTVRAVAVIVLFTFSGGLVSAQLPLPDVPKPHSETGGQRDKTLNRVAIPAQSEQETNPQTPESPQASADATSSEDTSEGKQPKRILWIIPNYRAVSANAQLPSLSVKAKFWLASQDSFDYSSFALAGIVPGISQAKQSNPEFGEDAYLKYYWHSFADQAVAYLQHGSV